MKTAPFAIAIALSALAWDPHAEAAHPKRALLLVVALAGLAWTATRKTKIESPAPSQSRARLFALAFVVVSALGALHGGGDVFALLTLLVVGVALALTAGTLGRAEALSTLRIATLCISGIAGGITVISALAGARGFSLHGGQGNPNWLGLLLAVSIPIVADLAYAWHRRGPRARSVVAIGVLVLSSLALGLSHSRVAWIACGVGLVTMFFRQNPSASLLRRAALTLGVVSALVALPNVPLPRRPTSTSTPAPAAHSSPLASPAHDEARSGEVDAATSLRGRLWIAKISVRAAVSSFPFGVGLGGYPDAYLREQGEALSTMSPKEASRRFLNATTAHDDFLQAAVTTGPLGLVCFAGAILAAIVAHLRSGTRAIAGALAAFAVCALGDSPMQQPALVALVALAFAALPAARIAKTDDATKHLVFSTRSHLALGLACALLLVPASRAWLGTRTRVAAESLEPEARLSKLGRAARIDPRSGENALALGLARLELGDADGALDALRRSLPLLPNVGTYVAIGNAELERARPDLAEAAYREALARDPGSRRAHADLAEALRRLTRLPEAEEHARIALQLGPGDARVRALVDQIHKDMMEMATQE